MPSAVGQQKALGTEFPQGSLLIPSQGAVVPVGFDEGVARRKPTLHLVDTAEADVDGFGQMGR